MKKKLLVALLSVATVMALAIPATALAVGSNEGKDVGSQTIDNVTISGRILPADFDGTLQVAAAGEDATITAAIGTLSSTQTLLGPWNVTLSGGGTFTELTLTFAVGSQYNGYKATVYHNHDGKIEKHDSAVKDGKVAVTVTGLSNFAIVVDSSATSNAGSTSPKTGMDMNLLALATGGMIVAAAAVALVARKRTQD